MFKKIYAYLNQIDFSKLTDFQRTLVCCIYSNSIRKV